MAADIAEVAMNITIPDAEVATRDVTRDPIIIVSKDAAMTEIFHTPDVHADLPMLIRPDPFL